MGRQTRAEVGLVFSLTAAQAAATLAAVIVGFEAGIFDETLVNAALIVVLVSLIIAPLGAARFARDVRPPATEGGRRLGETVLVPLANDAMEPRATLAALIARSDKGVVVPVALVPEPGEPAARALGQERLERVTAIVERLGVETESRIRVCESVAAGALRSAMEHEATCVLVSWTGLARARSAFFGGASEGLLAETKVPTLVVSTGAGPPARVVLALSREDVLPVGHPETLLAVRAARLIAAGLGVEPRILAPDPEVARPLMVGMERAPVDGFAGTRDEALATASGPGDVVVIPGRMSRSMLDGDAGRLAARPDPPTVVLAVLPVVSGARIPTPGVLAART